MRDPARQGPMIEKLEMLWEEYPDWRLGQLIVNLTRPNDTFNIEDDVMEDRMDKMIEELG